VIASYDNINAFAFSRIRYFHISAVILGLILQIISPIYYFSRLKTLELADALTVCFLDVGRVGIPLYLLLFVLNGNDTDSLIIFSGVIFFIGVLIYDEVLVIPFFGLKASVRRSRNKIKALLDIELMRRSENFSIILPQSLINTVD
jgi:hypothetical protein